MPTSTFFRLPEEKRQRLMDAAWAEFTRVRYVDASISKIIQGAHIPRGSFYQYFADKDELFAYLLGDMRAYFAHVLREILVEREGDLFAMPLAAFDRFVHRGGRADPGLLRCIQVMRRNHGMDIQWLADDQQRLLPDELAQQVNTAQLRSGEQLFLEHIFFLLMGALICAVMTTLQKPEQWERQREILRQRVDIVRLGSLAEGTRCPGTNKEETHGK